MGVLCPLPSGWGELSAEKPRQGRVWVALGSNVAPRQPASVGVTPKVQSRATREGGGGRAKAKRGATKKRGVAKKRKNRGATKKRKNEEERKTRSDEERVVGREDNH